MLKLQQADGTSTKLPFNNPDGAIHRIKVPLHGPLRSAGVQLEDHMSSLNYQSVFKHSEGGKSGLSGKILNYALSSKQQQSILTENYLRFQDTFYDERDMQTNMLIGFYPKQVEQNIIKRRHHHTEKVFRGVHAPQTKGKAMAALEKMKQLRTFQNDMLD